MKRKWPRGFPKGTIVEFIKGDHKNDIPYKNKRPYAVAYRVKHGTVPKVGDKGTVIGRTSVAGYYMVESKTHPVYEKQFGPITCLAIHRTYLKRTLPDNPSVDYRIVQKYEEGAIRVGRVWIVPEDAE